MKTESCLVVCRTSKDFAMIDDISKKVSSNIIVGSDMVQIQEMAKKDPRVREVIFLDQMISVLSVTDAALGIFHEINRWLVRKAPSLPSFLMEWAKHVEGGMTTQKIVDILICVDSYLYIVKKYGVRMIYLGRNAETSFEDDILICVAKSQDILVMEYTSTSYTLSRHLHLRMIKVRSHGINRALFIPEALVRFLLKWQLFFTVATKAAIPFTDKDHMHADEKMILFLLGSSADKHVDNITATMQEFNKKNGYTSSALCWRAHSGRNKILSKGLTATNLERWVSFKQLLKTLIQYRQVKTAIYADSSTFRDNPEIRYKGILLGALLTPSLKHFLEVDLLNRMLMYCALDNYFTNNRSAAMKTYGGVRVDYGRIACEILKRRRDRNTLIFQYWIGVNMDYRFGAPPSDAIDLLFVHGEADRGYVKQLAPNMEIVVAGFPRMSHIERFKNKSKEQSLHDLGISKHNKYIVFYASTGILSGTISATEADMVLDCMMRLAMQVNGITVLIKPHPNENANYMFEIFKRHNKPQNVLILDGTAPIYTCIRAADVIATTYSTVGLEAMMLEKPVISLALGGETKFQDIFGDGAVKIQDDERFLSFIEDVVSSEEKFHAWQEERIKRQNTWLPSKVWQPPVPVEKIIADTVINRLERLPVAC